MGLSIHYSGTIKSIEFIDALTEELTEICETLKWESHIFDGKNEDGLKGISFSPEAASLYGFAFYPVAVYAHPLIL